ncbi:MAG TPA: hypothetical protein VFA12_02920 [Stellaceae bacterium]|nr:hypothetical protein [Stellaceae bacterium]
MRIELLGILAVAIGCLGWFLRLRFSLYVFFASTLLGAGAALILTGFGGATIQPAHLLLGFLVLRAIAGRDFWGVTQTLKFPNEGFWLLATGVYAVVASIFFPRLFAGATSVFAVARTVIGPGIVLMPLSPTSGNITQPIYFIGDILCFLIAYAWCRNLSGLRALAQAAIACAVVNLGFAALDLGTYVTGTTGLLSFMRNANYRMLDEASISGLKRLVGSFPEASAFAYATLGLFAFCLRLALAGVRPRLTGTLAALSLGAIVMSLSSTGYAAAGGLLAAMFVVSLAQLLSRPVMRGTLAFLALSPLIIVLVIGIRLNEPGWRVVSTMFDKTIVTKMDSDSGLERARWNEQALKNFADTDGLGAGVGSVRASSFPIAVLGNIGVVGALTYGAFLFGVLFRRRGRWQAPFPSACQSGARWACFAQLLGASVAGSFIDLGLPFFIFAGLACARPKLAPQAARAPRQAAPLPAAAVGAAS